MPMIELFQGTVQLAADSLVFANPKDLGDLVGGEAEDSQFASALEDLVNGEIPPEDEILGTQSICGGLQGFGVGDPEEGIVILVEADALALSSLAMKE